MRPSQYLGPILFVAGVAVIAYALARGEATLSLLVIFPVLTATGPWAALGIALVIAAFVLSFLTWPWQVEMPSAPAPAAPPSSPMTPPAPQRRWGGVVFLGPIPIVFGSDARVTRMMLILGLVLFLALLALTVYVLWSI